MSSFFSFAGHTAPPVHYTGHPNSPTDTDRKLVWQGDDNDDDVVVSVAVQQSNEYAWS